MTTTEQAIVQQVLDYLDALPDGWDNYSTHWKCGYNQCRNRVALLLKDRRFEILHTITKDPMTL